VQRYFCIHGHFYQPPREHPWLESVELQDSAHPYHDWNERITAECYEPNASSRILDDEDRLIDVVNNYSRISFNVGPTLMGWLETKAPEIHEAILAADLESRAAHSGHGSALAQVYSHPILPLCNARDRRTQVLWGARDFAQRFGRPAEGMWLPETAVDLNSLEVLAEHGVRFTILSPDQAGHVRPLGTGSWHDVRGGRVDSRRPYRVRLQSGRTIDVFFYHGDVSHAVAFERLLSRGDQFAKRLVGAFRDDDDRPQLVHVATDGETYGHHHRHGDMALAFAVQWIEARGLARRTNYGEFLELHPPDHEVRILENSSWSCSHGLGRWSRDCGCSSEFRDGWRQAWRAPLREALDWLRDELAPRFERDAALLLADPWAARDDYIEVVLDRSPESVDAFLRRHAREPLGELETSRTLKLLELQRQAMLMYTSCGWFFEEPSRIETLQILRYAGRAVHLAQELFGEDLEPSLVERLALAPSNVAAYGDAGRIYERKVRPARVDLATFGANYAAGLLFDDPVGRGGNTAFSVRCDAPHIRSAGKSRLAVGRMQVTSRITREAEELIFGLLHLGDHNLSGGVRTFRGEESYTTMVREVDGAFSRGDLPEVLRLLDEHFLGLTYSLKTLFVDEQQRILERVLEETLEEVEAVYGRLYRDHASLIRFLGSLDAQAPRALQAAAELVLNGSLRRELDATELDPAKLGPLLEEAQRAGVILDREELGFAARGALERLFERFAVASDDLALLARLQTTVEVFRKLPFDVELGNVTNGFLRLARVVYPGYRRASDADARAREWVERFSSVARALRVIVD